MLRDPAASSSLTEALSQRFPTVHTAPFWWEAGPDGDGHRYVAELSIALQVRAPVGPGGYVRESQYRLLGKAGANYKTQPLPPGDKRPYWRVAW